MAVSLVPVATLAALGGAYPSATLPILAAAVVVFLMSRVRVGYADARTLDAALVTLAAGVALQVVPLPRSLVTILSPHLEPLRAALHLEAGSAPATLSVDPSLTRAGLASLVSALLVFWAAREVFSRGGLRVGARAVAWAGFALALVVSVQRATAPGLLLWTWTPNDPESQPFGPFVNRNHLATWLLMGASLTAGYLVSHTRSVSSSQASLRLRARDWLADGHGLLLAGALLSMLLGIVGTLSRSAILGAGAALLTGWALSRTAHRGRTARLAGAAVAVLLAVAIWSNREGLARKFESSASAGRVVIWVDTLPIIRDFWVTGTGIGTYAPTMLQYQRAFRDVHFNQAHSEYVQIAAEGGLLLVAPLLVAVYAAVQLARQRLHEDSRTIAWLRIGAAAGLTGAAVQGLFETGLRMPANGLLAALLAAVLLHQRHDR